MKKKLLIILALIVVGLTRVSAQNVAVKSNLFYDAFANINLGVEVGLAPKWTLDISGDYNAWNMSHDRRWKHWIVQPELRYWFCDRFAGHFVGVHAFGGQYNVGNLKNSIKFLGNDVSKWSDHRYEGWIVGGGIAYGYSWILSKHWSFEAELGFGVGYTPFDEYECDECGRRSGDGNYLYVGPTKAACNIVYVF